MDMVYSMNSVTKFNRKKLKTRKCLNKLRKKLFGDSDKDFSKDNSSASNINESVEYFKPKLNSMTTSHLILGFLHNAVQSETITRHDLSSIRMKSGISKNILDKKITTFNDHNSISSHSPTTDKIRNSFKEVLSANDCSKDFFCKANLSNSPSLFNSLISDITKVSSFEVSESDSLENMHATVSLKSLNNDRKDFGNCHIEELSSENIIEENPIRYIKLGCTKQQAAHWEAAPSTSSSGSSSLLSIHDTSSVCLDDTPECIYYPHRLNQ